MATSSALSEFHPEVASWFRTQVGEPTDVQTQAWPKIAAGEHVLVTAPTGTGKTLTAFLWAIDRLLSGAWPLGRVAVLYVSPLRALNTDIQRNLLAPLDQLRARFQAAGLQLPDVRVLTRSGDTPASERRQMLRRPPEILITTPESLNLLLSSRSGLDLLTGLRCVVLDEIHALVDSKRGTHLITAVDRLVRGSGEFQRIALSATVRPVDTVARFVGGYVQSGPVDAPRYEPRPVKVVRSTASKRYAIEVCFPESLDDESLREEAWAPLTEELRQRIHANRSTLVFVDSRRMAEKLTRLVNAAEGERVAYAHHGSLSREIRADVESRLKAGELRAIVATSSLEMGIDIGAIDEVVQVLPPPTIAAAIQRAGRAGHQVGQASHTSLYGAHALHLVEMAVIARNIAEHDLEPLTPVRAPVDVLAQVLISMVGLEARDVDEVFAELRASAPYHELSRRQFDLVVEMLAGRYADSRVRDLRARVSFDRTDNTLMARRGALQALYSSGGTIPDRGEFKLRHQNGDALIGTLDEEFVWEAKVGDNFLLGTQSWQIQAITHNDVFVTPAGERGKAPPFWRGEEQSRGYHLSRRIGEFLETADTHAQAGTLGEWLRDGFFLSDNAAATLGKFLVAQRDHTHAALPHRHHLLVEQVSRGPSGAPGHQMVLHTHWGGRVNRPFAMALESAWTEAFGERPEIFVGNDAVVLQLAEAVDAGTLTTLVRTSNIERHLRSRLEGSGFFGARFREAAGRALLLPKRKFGERLPLWMNRLRAQRLLEAVHDYGDFPIVLEAWRSCLQDELDLDSLQRVLGELEAGVITVGTAVTSSASPMAKTMSWAQVSEYMYRRDEPQGGGASKPSLRDDLIAEVARSEELRPRISAATCDTLAAKLSRTAAGYAPRDITELLDWIKDRLVVPHDEWVELLAAIAAQGREVAEITSELADKLVVATVPADRPGRTPASIVVAVEMLERVVMAWYGHRPGSCLRSLDGTRELAWPNVEPVAEGDDLALRVLSQVLTFYGPAAPSDLSTRFALPDHALTTWLDALESAESIVTGVLRRDVDEWLVCDARNFETLLRIERARATPQFAALSAKWLAPFLASIQGIGVRRASRSPDDGLETLANVTEMLLALPLPCATWEAEVFPARVAGYRGEWLDRLLAESDLRFVGSEGHKLAFSFQGELDLLADAEPESSNEPADAPWRELFADPNGRYDLRALTHAAGRLSSDVMGPLWQGVFAGEVSCDRFAPIRRGIETDFADSGANVSSERPRARGRWRPNGLIAPPGSWHLLQRGEAATNALDREERNKDRVRLLLDRYGVLFRALLTRESAGFRWRDLFRSLRLMELSGEVLAGQFFEGVDGLQFISHRAFRHLVDTLPRDAVYWINATDPASLCGVTLTGDAPALPRRVASTHVVYRGPKVVLVSRRFGKDVEFFVEPNDPQMAEILAVFGHLLSRDAKPHKRLTVATIDGAPARHSRFLADLRAAFDVSAGPSELTLETRR